MRSDSRAGDPAQHRRFTDLDLIHHLLGNGDLQAVIQVTRKRAVCNALVLHLMNPDRFHNRPKSSSFTFHQRLGPAWTTVGLAHEGRLYLPHPRQLQADLRCGLDFSEGMPRFQARYPCDYTIDGEHARAPFAIEESWFMPARGALLCRRICVRNERGLAAAEARLLALLVPNETIFPDLHFRQDVQVGLAGDRDGGDEWLGLTVLSYVAHGWSGSLADLLALASRSPDDRIRPSTEPEGVALSVELGTLAPGAAGTVDFLYAYGSSEEHLLETVAGARARGVNFLASGARAYWQGTNFLRVGDEQLDDFFCAMRAGIRAAAGRTGEVNAGIWGFNDEWVRDSSLFCVGAILSGQVELARSILDHLIRERFNEEGIAFGESRFYEPRHHEPDQNGELLYALWLYWVHARDDSLIHNHWTRLVRIAEFPIGPRFWVSEANMIKSERDIRERDRERHGLEEGFELAYQMWVSLGLRKGADMADHVGDEARARQWRQRAELMWDAALHHPRYRLVENGYFMKRRLLDGSFQRQTRTIPYVHRISEETVRLYPRNLDRDGELEPDHSEVYPIALGMIDPQSALAQRTLRRMEQLWNQEWDFGGYPLQHAGSEPTKLGAHTLPWQVITQAALLARDYDTVRRNLDYFLETPEGRGYAWWEYRDADPALQIDHGITSWFIYAEPMTFFIHDLLGYRPGPTDITIWPHLLPEMNKVQARLRCGEHWLHLQLHNGGPVVQRATVDGRAHAELTSDRVILPVPSKDTIVEIWLGSAA